MIVALSQQKKTVIGEHNLFFLLVCLCCSDKKNSVELCSIFFPAKKEKRKRNDKRDRAKFNNNNRKRNSLGNKEAFPLLYRIARNTHLPCKCNIKIRTDLSLDDCLVARQTQMQGNFICSSVLHIWKGFFLIEI